MANLQNAIKQIRKDAKRTVRNQEFRADLKTMIKKSKKMLEAKEAGASELLAQIQKKIDKGIAKGIIKKNTGARKLSRVFAHKAKASAK